MSIILIILGILFILFILFLIFLAISFLLLCKGLDNREIEAHQLVKEEKKAIADLHNSIYYKLLSDRDDL